MTQLSTLEELAAQLAAQNEELESSAALAEAIPDGITIDRRVAEALDDVTEVPHTGGVSPVYVGIRA